jgi:hypothetical protein
MRSEGRQLTLDDLQQGRALRDQGVEQVLDNAPEEWKERARPMLERWFEGLNVDGEFTGEDARVSIVSSVGLPHHSNAWGAVFGGALRRWMRLGRVERVGIAQARDPISHASWVPTYRKTS